MLHCTPSPQISDISFLPRLDSTRFIIFPYLFLFVISFLCLVSHLRRHFTSVRRIPRYSSSPLLVSLCSQSAPLTASALRLPSPSRLPPVCHCSYCALTSSAAGIINMASAAANQPVYRHYRKDFGPLATKPLHLNLDFDIKEEKVTVTTTTTFQHAHDEPISVLKLNSKELQIVSVEQMSGASELVAEPGSDSFISHVASFAQAQLAPLTYELDTHNHFLNINLKQPLNKGEQIVIKTGTIATPTAHILEGLYYDYTPKKSKFELLDYN